MDTQSHEAKFIILQGIKMIWGVQLHEADEIFETQKNVAPRYALHHAEIAFIRCLITANVDDIRTAFTRLKRAAMVAEAFIKEYEKKHYHQSVETDDESNITSDQPNEIEKIIDARTCHGEILCLMATLYICRETKIKGAFCLRKSWKSFESALKESKSTIADNAESHQELMSRLNFGIGLFLFVSSLLPPKLLKLIESNGLKANKDESASYIKASLKKEGIRETASTLLLLTITAMAPKSVYDSEDSLKEADILIKEGIDQYPNSPLFHYLASLVARKRNDVDGAIHMIEAATKNSLSFTENPMNFRYELANCLCMQLKWEDAANIYSQLFNEPKFHMRSICGLQLAACYSMLGEKEKSENLYKMLSSGDIVSNYKKSDLDGAVARQASRYLANGGAFAALELLYLRGDMISMISKIDELSGLIENISVQIGANTRKAIPVEQRIGALSKFDPLKSVFKSNDPQADFSFDNRASYCLLKGFTSKMSGKNDVAVNHFHEIIKMQDHIKEKALVAYCLYELGELYCQIKENLSDAEEVITKCTKINTYDWENNLKMKLFVLSQQLQHPKE